jgi:serine/threonine protein kinase
VRLRHNHPTVPDLLPGAEFAGCRIEAVAGRGGMGVVFRATDLALDRPVALKLIAPDAAQDPVFRARFEHECRAAAAIDHPHAVEVFHAGEQDGILFVTMRFVGGPTSARSWPGGSRWSRSVRRR